MICGLFELENQSSLHKSQIDIQLEVLLLLLDDTQSANEELFHYQDGKLIPTQHHKHYFMLDRYYTACYYYYNNDLHFQKVLALYPQTTCFYPAIIHEQPSNVSTLFIMIMSCDYFMSRLNLNIWYCLKTRPILKDIPLHQMYHKDMYYPLEKQEESNNRKTNITINIFNIINNTYNFLNQNYVF